MSSNLMSTIPSIKTDFSVAKVAKKNKALPNPPRRTLDDVRSQVAQEVAIRAITKCKHVEGVRVGVSLTYANSDEAFMRYIADTIENRLVLGNHLFAIATSGPSDDTSSPVISTSSPQNLILCGSSEDFVQRAILLASSKFLGRIESSLNSHDKLWAASVRGIGTSSYDEDALWDVVEKAVRPPIDPLLPPPGSKGIDQILAEARAKLQRITPAEALEELRENQVGAPTFLVDIRPAAQREAEGGIHGSLIIERNVLEWRFDPRSDARLSIVDRYDLRVIVFCQEGYTSSLAAVSLQELGLLNATDIIGGYQAWKDAGLPVDRARYPSRSFASLAGSIV